MYIKRLKITTPRQVIQNIEFKEGLNLIVDNTSKEDTKTTGNNVGKTTVLKLIDFCLGAEPNIIYTDIENKKELMHDNQLIKVSEYVKDKNIQLIISILKDKLPAKALENAHIAVELSQNSKLFKIEEIQESRK